MLTRNICERRGAASSGHRCSPRTKTGATTRHGLRQSSAKAISTLCLTIVMSAVGSCQLISTQPKTVDIDVSPRLDVEPGAVLLTVADGALTGLEAGAVVIDPLRIEVAEGAVRIDLRGAVEAGAVVIDTKPIGTAITAAADITGQIVYDASKAADARMGEAVAAIREEVRTGMDDITKILWALCALAGVAVLAFIVNMVWDNRRADARQV